MLTSGISAAANTLLDSSTSPAFASFFAGARFFAVPQVTGGIFVASPADQTNRIFFSPADATTGGNDVATGNNLTDIIQANDGDDNIQGAGGDDFLFGGFDDDIVRGDAGDDVVVGQEGSDVAIGGLGSDIFEFFADQFTAGEIDTLLDFNPDEDAIVVVGSTDIAYDPIGGLVSVDGVELVEVAPDLGIEVITRANSAIIVGASTDLSAFGVADEPVDETLEDALVNLPATDVSSAAATLLPGSTVPAFAAFFAGARFFDAPSAAGGIFAQGADGQPNTLLFAAGDAVIGGNDVATGASGTDIIQSGDGDDNIQGAGGDDFVFGGFDDDIVRGDAGDDVLVGQQGSDLAIGGSGSDIFEFFADQFATGELDTLLDFNPDEDAIVIVGSTDVEYDSLSGLVSVDGVELVEVAPDLGIEVITRTNSAIIVGASTDLSTFGVADEPVDETLEDTLVNLPATDFSSAAATFLPGSSSPAFASFFAGARFFDEAQAGGGIFARGEDGQTNTVFFAGSSAENGGNDVYAGSTGTDIVQAGDGDDNVQGAAGDDFLFGGFGDDIVRGDAGDDVLVGQEGSDIAIGGPGADVFEFFADQFAAGELDTLLDFNPDEDTVVVVGSTDVSFNSSTGLVSVDGVELIEIAADLDVAVIARENSSVIVGATALPELDVEAIGSSDDAGDLFVEQFVTAGGDVALDVTGAATATGATVIFSEVDDASGSNASFVIEAFLDGEALEAIAFTGTVAEPGGSLEVAFGGAAFDRLVISDAEGDVTATISDAIFSGLSASTLS